MRNMARSEGLGWGMWLVILLGVLLIAGAITLAVIGGHVTPQRHEVEQVISNDRFPS